MNFIVQYAIVLIGLFTANPTKASRLSPQIAPSSSPLPQPSVVITDERCPNSSSTICHDLSKLTACLSGSSAASKDLFLLVQNEGEDPLKVSLTFSNNGLNLPELQLSQNQAKKIKILAHMEGSPSIILDAGYGKCIIYVGSAGRYSRLYKQYVGYLSPVHSAYFLFITVLVAGGVWTCCKIGKNERLVDGKRYQELEMGRPVSDASNDEEEMAGGWDQDWDDGWEEQEEDEVSLPSGHPKPDVSANGLNSNTSDTNGWGNDWDD